MSTSGNTAKTRLVTGVSGRYAIALFDLIQAEKTGKKLIQQVADIQAALTPELITFLQNPAADNAQKESVLTEVAKKMQLEKTLTNFLKLVARKGRADALPAMLADVRRLEDRKNGLVKVDVRSAAKLTKSQEKDIEAFVKQMAPAAKKVEMTVGLDKTLIAGTKIRVGDTAYDNSLSGRMAAMATNLRQKAQMDD